MNPISVSSLNTSLGGKADAGHNHVIADVTGLQAGLDAKATVTYVNTQLSSLNASNVTTLPTLHTIFFTTMYTAFNNLIFRLSKRLYSG